MNQVVFITGASSGIGHALAQQLAPKGIALALAARRTDLLEALCENARQSGGEAIALTCDVGDQAQVKQAIADTVARFGRIDLAILSAGIGGPTNAADFKAEKFQRLLQTNLLGVAFCLEELLPLMRQQGDGTIAAISSLAGDRGFPGSAGYCATKAALSTLFDGLRVDLKAFGVNLVTIEPGYVQTPMTESFGKMPFMMQADEAARLILRRLERGDRVIRFPFAASAFMKLMRILPVSLFDRIAAKRRPIKVN
ncbi:MAG: SDR family NAD(P)-dependent oxidoreductase [Acidobacteriota bacterium]|nr:SDR family NAD(P)-dependent oxidoreductase [Acidobacteriota bacterium]